ncbi:dihydrolipoamide acetyltransferase family protein [Novosphingobium pentaromativorans]|uniref:Dihydrolipoamide acetyltransferase component of pyruvate dehydrogenase complex n=1 Tax=Novosphingobium pentaromativorans US6-1 TaxID=1088721 RepID=G6EI59_9SPHN|nr:dihydrolipoamide acetyltransferase family protein [Novosphingobium pentaromativorans]AIT78691.1 branched-chain alpha-keto acid dehydrogenase subunit E2 [Novosphingobium pentaromativorans US6-1]EHJ58801.1 2-oxoisovalerate dehydrogenase E2 component (dihydrolipoyl transacylase) [Novosphingobium pentaromativorans US6-1]
MGRYTFRLPDIGEGIAEAEIVAWHVKIGDMVEEDGRVADMMTDKATVEMESPVSGKVIEVAGAEGDVIAIGSPLVVIEVEGEGNERDGKGGRPAAAPAPAPEETAAKEPAAVPAPEPAFEPAPAPVAEKSPAPAPAPAPTPSPAPVPARAMGHTRVMASPAVRKRAADLGIDLGEVRPAEDGRIRHSDLDAFLSYNAAGGFQPAGLKGKDEQVRVIGLRRRIAENMAASKRQIPHFAYVEEFDVTALEETRAQLNEGRGDRPKLTMLPFLIAAICKLMPRYPMLNAHYDDEAGVVTRYGSVHLGMAAQTPAGLMVPVIRDAQDRNLWQLASEISRLARAARDGSAKSTELSGSTITLTSLGPMGGVATTPVINRPEVAIIGPNRIVERPMFVRDAGGVERIEKRKTMNISMSCDHRVVDGWDAASFAQDLKKLIEAPALILAG